MAINPSDRRLPLRFAISVACVFLLALAVFYWLMRPPLPELLAVGGILSLAALLSIGMAHLAYRRQLTSRLPSLNWQLLAGYVLLGVLVLLSVWATAALMFVSRHDLLLAAVLLLFEVGTAIAVTYYLACSVTDRIVGLTGAAKAIASGHSGERVRVTGQDEIADLARTFNEMAEQLEESDRRQRESDRLRRDLFAWIGHDLRTPLASVRAVVEALADGIVEDPATETRYLLTARQQIDTLSSLLDDLFDLAQIDAGGLVLQPDTTSIRDLVSDTLAAFSALSVQRGIRLQGSVTPGIDLVVMDARRIAQVLTNLLQNAMRHTPSGGLVELNVVPFNGAALVEVRDTGEGIAPEDVPLVFESFYRGEKSRSRSTGGTGLGLAIASGIVEAHRGQIAVESSLGEGTRIWFTLPL